MHVDKEVLDEIDREIQRLSETRRKCIRIVYHKHHTTKCCRNLEDVVSYAFPDDCLASRLDIQVGIWSEMNQICIVDWTAETAELETGKWMVGDFFVNDDFF